MSDPLSPSGNYDLYMSHVLPSGVDTRAVAAHIGGSLWRALDEFGQVGIAQNGISAGFPSVALPAIPAGSVRVVVAPMHGVSAYPEVSSNPGSPSDALDSALDSMDFDLILNVAKALPDYQILKTWCEGLGGTYEPLPTRP